MATIDDEVFPVDENDDDVVVTIDTEDGSTVTCEIITIFEVGTQDYIALLPTLEDGEEIDTDEVYLYRYFEDEDGFPSLGNIESEEEYEAVEDRFDERMDEHLFEED